MCVTPGSCSGLWHLGWPARPGISAHWSSLLHTSLDSFEIDSILPLEFLLEALPSPRCLLQAPRTALSSEPPFPARMGVHSCYQRPPWQSQQSRSLRSCQMYSICVLLWLRLQLPATNLTSTLTRCVYNCIPQGYNTSARSRSLADQFSCNTLGTTAEISNSLELAVSWGCAHGKTPLFLAVGHTRHGNAPWK